MAVSILAIELSPIEATQLTDDNDNSIRRRSSSSSSNTEGEIIKKNDSGTVITSNLELASSGV